MQTASGHWTNTSICLPASPSFHAVTMTTVSPEMRKSEYSASLYLYIFFSFLFIHRPGMPVRVKGELNVTVAVWIVYEVEIVEECFSDKMGKVAFCGGLIFKWACCRLVLFKNGFLSVVLWIQVKWETCRLWWISMWTVAESCLFDECFMSCYDCVPSGKFLVW